MHTAYVIGWPLENSLSKVFQNKAFESCGIEAEFLEWKLDPNKIEDVRERLLDKSCLGACVTVPHKENILNYLDDIDQSAQTIGAVNWIKNRDKKLVGYNTDGEGLITALKDDHKIDVLNKTICLYGAGGAAKATIYALKKHKAKKVLILNRTKQKAQKIATRYSTDGFEVSVANKSTGALSFDLFINASSVGMAGSTGDGATPIQKDEIPTKTVAYDLVYTPKETPFMRAVTDKGGVAYNGITMLVRQGALGFEILTGRKAPVKTMFSAIGVKKDDDS